MHNICATIYDGNEIYNLVRDIVINKKLLHIMKYDW